MNRTLYQNLLFLIAIFVTPAVTKSQTIANCKDLSGYSYFNYKGIIKKNESGFDRDKISGGITTFEKVGPDKYDILILDARKSLYSLTQDGGKIILMRKSKDEVAFLHYHDKTELIEIYSIWTDADKKVQFTLLQNRSSGAFLPKSSLLVGVCDFLDLSSID